MRYFLSLASPLQAVAQKGNQEGSTTIGTSETQTTENSSEVKKQDDQSINFGIPTDYSSLTEEEIERAIGAKPEQDDSDNSKDLMNWYYERDKYISQNAYNSSDGMYHYYVAGLELVCKTNVWDYIYKDSSGEYVYNFYDMAVDIGLQPRYFSAHCYQTEPLQNDDGSLKGRYYIKNESGSRLNTPYGYEANNTATGIWDSDIDSYVYKIGSSDESWGDAASFNLIVVSAYQMERFAEGENEKDVVVIFSSWPDGEIPHR